MPELPEVETFRRNLESLVAGFKIEDISVYWPRIIAQEEGLDVFKARLIGQTILRVERRGKYLLFKTEDYTLLSHLRMEGKYHMRPRGQEKEKHDHVIFHFENYDQDLVYEDTRKFGRMEALTDQELEAYFAKRQLGEEPFEDTFSLDHFSQYLRKTSRPIKTVLLDQKAVAGVGNIYADEALYLAQIHPLRPANTIKLGERIKLRQAIIDTIAKAIEAGGSTVSSYRTPLGESGSFQNQHFVYNKKGQPCPRCGKAIEKITVGGRGTHFCPRCQTLRKSQLTLAKR